MRQTLAELSASLQALPKTIEIICSKVGSQRSTDLGERQTPLSEVAHALREENKKQKTIVDDNANQLRTFPTREDVQKLREPIDTLNACAILETQRNSKA